MIFLFTDTAGGMLRSLYTSLFLSFPLRTAAPGHTAQAGLETHGAALRRAGIHSHTPRRDVPWSLPSGNFGGP